MNIRFVFTLALLLFAVQNVHAGSITGTVNFEGDAPEMKPLDTSADPVCAMKHKESPLLNETLVLGEGQTMANVLVRIIKGLPEGKEYPVPEEPVLLTQEGCQYSPHVFGIRPGQTLRVLNPDGTLHNVNCMPRTNKPFNRAMPSTITEMEEVFTVPEEAFSFKCDVHPWMRAFCAVIEHPFFMVTEKDGKYSIEGLDPGEYEIEAWHERLGPKSATVTVAEGADATADFTFSRN